MDTIHKDLIFPQYLDSQWVFPFSSVHVVCRDLYKLTLALLGLCVKGISLLIVYIVLVSLVYPDLFQKKKDRTHILSRFILLFFLQTKLLRQYYVPLLNTYCINWRTWRISWNPSPWFFEQKFSGTNMVKSTV